MNLYESLNNLKESFGDINYFYATYTDPKGLSAEAIITAPNEDFAIEALYDEYLSSGDDIIIEDINHIDEEVFEGLKADFENSALLGSTFKIIKADADDATEPESREELEEIDECNILESRDLSEAMDLPTVLAKLQKVKPGTFSVKVTYKSLLPITKKAIKNGLVSFDQDSCYRLTTRLGRIKVKYYNTKFAKERAAAGAVQTHQPPAGFKAPTDKSEEGLFYYGIKNNLPYLILQQGNLPNALTTVKYYVDDKEVPFSDVTQMVEDGIFTAAAGKLLEQNNYMLINLENIESIDIPSEPIEEDPAAEEDFAKDGSEDVKESFDLEESRDLNEEFYNDALNEAKETWKSLNESNLINNNLTTEEMINILKQYTNISDDEIADLYSANDKEVTDKFISIIGGNTMDYLNNFIKNKSRGIDEDLDIDFIELIPDDSINDLDLMGYDCNCCSDTADSENFANCIVTPEAAAKAVMISYQNANKWLDSIKEALYSTMGCPFFSNFIHTIAHMMPQEFDKFGDILHTANIEVPYPATEEIANLPDSITTAFEFVFEALDNIKVALNDFIKVTDEEYHGMACAAENLLNTIEAEYPALYRLRDVWANSNNDKVAFDKYVCQYADHKDDLLD